MVSKDDLLKAVWPDSFIEESNLTQHIFVLRKMLGDGVEEKRYIVTVPGRGYRFDEKVTVVAVGEVVISQGTPELAGDDDSVVIAKHTRSRTLVEEQQSRQSPAGSATKLGQSRHRCCLCSLAWWCGVFFSASLDAASE